MMNRRAVLTAGAATAAGGAVAVGRAARRPGARPAGAPPGAGGAGAVPRPAGPRPGGQGHIRQAGAAWFTNARLQAHDGRTLRFYADLLRGKIVLINFIFTACGDICPTVNQTLARVQQRLGERVGRDIFLYSLSLDPEHDTPQLLRLYAEAFEAGPGWLFLTGRPDDIELLRHRLGFVYSDPVRDADRSQHLGAVRIGNEPLHLWTMCPGLAAPEAIVRSVMRLVPNRA